MLVLDMVLSAARVFAKDCEFVRAILIHVSNVLKSLVVMCGEAEHVQMDNDVYTTGSV